MFLAVLELHVAWSHNHQKYCIREKALISWKSAWLDHHNVLQRLRSGPNVWAKADYSPLHLPSLASSSFKCKHLHPKMSQGSVFILGRQRLVIKCKTLMLGRREYGGNQRQTEKGGGERSWWMKSWEAKVTGKQQDRVRKCDKETRPRKTTRSMICCMRTKNCASRWDYHISLQKSGFVFQEVIIYSANSAAPLLTLRNLCPLNYTKYCISETIIPEI